MNESTAYRGRWALALGAMSLFVSACGAGEGARLEDAGVESGETVPGSQPVAVVTSELPSYCESLWEFAELGPVGNEEFLDRVISFAQLVAREGPEEVADDYALLAEGLGGLDAVFATHGYETDLDTVELTAEEESDLLLGGLALVGLDDLEESWLELAAECGLEDPQTSPAVRTPGGLASTGTTEAPVDAATLTQVLEGPFGVGTHGHVELRIASVSISNVGFGRWGEPGAAPTDPDARYLYVGLAITNLDPNDSVVVPPEAIELLVDGVSVGSASQVNISVYGPGVDAQAADDREYGWEIEESIGLDRLALRYGGTSVPVVIPFDADAADTGYPIEAGSAGSGSFMHGLGCLFEWTVEVENVSYLLDVPAEFSNAPAPASNRAASGERLVLVEGFVTTGPADCVGAVGNINSLNLRLVVDGRPFEPAAAPNEALFPNETLELAVLWSIPVDVEELAFRAFGTQGDQLDLPLPLPALATVEGE